MFTYSISLRIRTIIAAFRYRKDDNQHAFPMSYLKNLQSTENVQLLGYTNSVSCG